MANSIRAGYQRFKDEKHAAELAAAAQKHGLEPKSLQAFVDTILSRMIFHGEPLTELLSPLELGWRARTEKELALMADLVPLLKKRAGGRDISGLKAYEE
jgi:type I restriction enzyme R subunit